mmetsp:Transcript_43477/g.80919  ORF Transcript_43477/g.80919 Transcript_43477/m.80919 type:complete len:89 (-) Transcript_43477:124-390(-)
MRVMGARVMFGEDTRGVFNGQWNLLNATGNNGDAQGGLAPFSLSSILFSPRLCTAITVMFGAVCMGQNCVESILFLNVSLGIFSLVLC